MQDDRIDFISAYCDRWCERCAFTTRCSAFALQAAIGMCDDTREAYELALGTPKAPRAASALSAANSWLANLDHSDVSDAELAQFRRQEDERRARVEATEIASMTEALMQVSHRWLRDRAQALQRSADVVLREAAQIVAHDTFLVSAKLHRALDGRDRHLHDGEDDEEGPVQNDWNGSAKVALISLQRSQEAWRVIAQATREDVPALLAAHTAELQAMVEREFPSAWSFVRPGFDERKR